MGGSYYFDDVILFQSKEIPLRIYYEYRPGARYSIGKKYFIFRIPIQLAESKKVELITYGKNWAKKVLSKDPTLTKNFQPRIYVHGEVIKCFDREWTVKMILAKKYFVRVRPAENLLELGGPEKETESSDEDLSRAVQKLFSSWYRNTIKKRTLVIAQKHQFPMPQIVSLKYMSTRWGSCRKSRGTISLNTKLLLAPQEVLDSVIVHELSHLIHPNHSLSFWKLVKQCDPDFKKHNNWLKTHGNQLVL